MPTWPSANSIRSPIAGEAAAGYFDPASTEAIAAAITAFFASSTPRATWSERSRTRAAESTWRRAAQMTRAAMAAIAR